MSNSIIFPALINETQFGHWSDKPHEEIQRALNEIKFTPTKISICMRPNIYVLARFLAIEVPQSTTKGTFERNGITFKYQWDSTEGRSIDMIHIDCDFSTNIVHFFADMKASEGLKNKISLIYPADCILSIKDF